MLLGMCCVKQVLERGGDDMALAEVQMPQVGGLVGCKQR